MVAAAAAAAAAAAPDDWVLALLCRPFLHSLYMGDLPPTSNRSYFLIGCVDDILA